MKNKTSISVFITIKESSNTLSLVLRAFLLQTVLPKQLIVVGKPTAILATKNKLNPNEVKNITWFTFTGDKNLARNIGFRHCNAEAVMFVDHDMIPDRNLLVECTTLLDRFDALYLPESGQKNGNFYQRIFALEKKLVAQDPAALTPRIFRRSLFRGEDKPFSPKFGVLDEWGFFVKLKEKKVRIGKTHAGFHVTDTLTLRERVRKNVEKGLKIRNILSVNTREGIKRMDPVTRGLVVYGKQLAWLWKQPLEFCGLVMLKFIDLMSFYLGYALSFIPR